MPENESDRVWSTCATCQFISCDQINVKEVTDDIIDKVLTKTEKYFLIFSLHQSSSRSLFNNFVGHVHDHHQYARKKCHHQ